MCLAMGFKRPLPISCKMSFMCNEGDILQTQGTRLHSPGTIGVFDSSRTIGVPLWRFCIPIMDKIGYIYTHWESLVLFIHIGNPSCFNGIPLNYSYRIQDCKKAKHATNNIYDLHENS